MEEKRKILDQLLSNLRFSAAQMSGMASELGDHDMQNGFQYVYNEGMLDGLKKGRRSGALMGTVITLGITGLCAGGYMLKEYYNTKKRYELEQEEIRRSMNNNAKHKEVVVLQSDVQEESNKSCSNKGGKSYADVPIL